MEPAVPLLLVQGAAGSRVEIRLPVEPRTPISGCVVRLPDDFKEEVVGVCLLSGGEYIPARWETNPGRTALWVEW